MGALLLLILFCALVPVLALASALVLVAVVSFGVAALATLGGGLASIGAVYAVAIGLARRARHHASAALARARRPKRHLPPAGTANGAINVLPPDHQFLDFG